MSLDEVGPERVEPLTVFCADIGSVKGGNFGWAGLEASGHTLQGHDMDGLANAVCREIGAGRPTALGFEAPLFVPYRNEPALLNSARRGEGTRAWSAGAGCGALATGLVQVTWLLRSIRERAPGRHLAFTEWSRFVQAGQGLFLWEAFVSGASKPAGEHDPHVADALAAAGAFRRSLPNPDLANVIDEPVVFSLLGAALLRTGWSDDLAVLRSPCLVVRH